MARSAHAAAARRTGRCSHRRSNLAGSSLCSRAHAVGFCHPVARTHGARLRRHRSLAPTGSAAGGSGRRPATTSSSGPGTAASASTWSTPAPATARTSSSTPAPEPCRPGHGRRVGDSAGPPAPKDRPRARLTGKTLCITFVTLGELTKWTVLRSWGPRKLVDLAQWRSGVVLLPFDEAVATTWGQLQARAQHRGRPRPTNDSWIAACCLADRFRWRPSTARTSPSTTAYACSTCRNFTYRVRPDLGGDRPPPRSCIGAGHVADDVDGRKTPRTRVHLADRAGGSYQALP